MSDKIILASKSKVRKKILEENGISCEVEPANVDEDLVKESLIKENWCFLYIILLNWAFKAKNILSSVSPVESETK